MAAESRGAEFAVFGEVGCTIAERKRLFMVAFSTDHFKNGQLNFPSSQFIGEKNLSDYIDFVGE